MHSQSQWHLELYDPSDQRVIATAMLYADEHRAMKAAAEENAWLEQSDGSYNTMKTHSRYWRAAKVKLF